MSIATVASYTDACILLYKFNILGESFASLRYLYRIPSQTIGKIVQETCQAIVDVLSTEFLKVCKERNAFLVIVGCVVSVIGWA